MFGGTSAIRAAALVLLAATALVACAPDTAPPASPQPRATPTPTPTSEPPPVRPKPAFPATCAELGAAVAVESVVGPLAFSTGGDPTAPLTTYPEAVGLAGGKLDCVWGDVGGPALGVGVTILPRTSTDRFEAYAAGQEPGCLDGPSGMPWVVCGEELSIGGYWVSVAVHAGEGSRAADVAPRYAAFTAALTSFVTSAAPPPTIVPSTSELAAPLCTGGAATLSAALGVLESDVLEPGYGGYYDINVAAGDRAGAGGCPWDVTGRGSWEFHFLPNAAWAFEEPLRPYVADRGLEAETVPLLGEARVTGADGARLGCSTNGVCEAQLLLGDEFLIAIHRPADEAGFRTDLEAILARL